MSVFMLVTMVLCFALTVSVAVSIGLSAMLGIQMSNANMLISVKEMFSSLNRFPLAAIPFFILAGNIMETGGISRRLVEFAKSLVGGVQGGVQFARVGRRLIGHAHDRAIRHRQGGRSEERRYGAGSVRPVGQRRVDLRLLPGVEEPDVGAGRVMAIGHAG